MSVVKEWKPFRTYPYHISSDGEIKSLRRPLVGRSGSVYLSKEKLLKPAMDKCGYFRFAIPIDGKLTTFKLHRVVCEVFHGNSELEVNHIDGNKGNNQKDNLEWISRSNNIKHAFKIGLAKPMRGSSNPTAKINETIALRVIELLELGVGPVQISRELSISKNITKDISRGRTWKHLRKQPNS